MLSANLCLCIYDVSDYDKNINILPPANSRVVDIAYWAFPFFADFSF